MLNLIAKYFNILHINQKTHYIFMKIFITGIAGFLGSHLAKHLIDLGHEVSGNDNMIGGDL